MAQLGTKSDEPIPDDETVIARNKMALLHIAEDSTVDAKARVAASRELNIMLSVGDTNKTQPAATPEPRRVTNIKALVVDPATQRLLASLGGRNSEGSKSPTADKESAPAPSAPEISYAIEDDDDLDALLEADSLP